MEISCAKGESVVYWPWGDSMRLTIGAAIAQNRQKRGLSQTELARRLGDYGLCLTNKAVSSWENELARPSVHQMLALCDILGIDDIWWELAGLHKGPYAGLNDAGRRKARELIDLVFRVDAYRDEEPADAAAPRLLRLYAIGVSAGRGNPLDESDYELMEAPDYVPPAADFALRIAGDSMEPLYLDGQIIWVRRQPTLESGEIGVLLYDGEVYCKRYLRGPHGVLLRSLNGQYADIAVTDGGAFSVIGRVVA